MVVAAGPLVVGADSVAVAASSAGYYSLRLGVIFYGAAGEDSCMVGLDGVPG